MKLVAAAALSLLMAVAAPALAHHRPDHADNAQNPTVTAAEPLAVLLIGAGLVGAIVLRRKSRK
jgi:hypothetical protein